MRSLGFDMPFIVFEGIDGSGTTSHSKALVERLRERGEKVVWRSSPGNGPIGLFVRSIFEGRVFAELPGWRTMLYLFQAALEEQVPGMFEEMSDSWLVLDRYWYSSLVYQVTSAEAAAGSFAESTDASEIIRRINNSMPIPNLLIVLDVPVSEGLGRNKKDHDFYEKKDFLEVARNGYRNIETTAATTVHISTSGKKPSVVWQEIDKAVSEKFV